jgi:hypothetical protein
MRWWTFAGTATNALLAEGFRSVGLDVVSLHDLGIYTKPIPADGIGSLLASIVPEAIDARVPAAAIEQLKFATCLPDRIARNTLRARIFSPVELRKLLRRAPKLTRSRPARTAERPR